MKRFTRKITNNKFNRIAFYETERDWCEVSQGKHARTKKWQDSRIEWNAGMRAGPASSPNRSNDIANFTAMLKAANKLAQKWQKEAEEQV